MGRNQKGFTLVELIVVIAIMAVVATMGLLSFSVVTGQDVKSCAADIKSYIGQTKVHAMSRANATMTLSVKSDGVYVNLSVEGHDVQVGKSGIAVSYRTDDGGTVTLNATDTLVLSFDRSSGAFLQLPDGKYCTAIVLNGGGRTITITLIPQTGKYYID